ncbi:hypothetical protein X975_21003, partial [Stegodyphus mimosarum]
MATCKMLCDRKPTKSIASMIIIFISPFWLVFLK